MQIVYLWYVLLAQLPQKCPRHIQLPLERDGSVLSAAPLPLLVMLCQYADIADDALLYRLIVAGRLGHHAPDALAKSSVRTRETIVIHQHPIDSHPLGVHREHGAHPHDSLRNLVVALGLATLIVQKSDESLPPHQLQPLHRLGLDDFNQNFVVSHILKSSLSRPTVLTTSLFQGERNILE